MPAAISAPNTASSRISVIGTEVISALRKSEFISALPTASVLAPPASATSRRGYRAWTAATAATSARDRGVGGGVRPGDPERDQRAAPAGRDQRPAARAERRGDVLGRPGQPRAARPRPPPPPAASAGSLANVSPGAARLDQHALGGRGDHAQLVQDLLGLPGLARVVLRPALRAEQLAGQERQPHQHQPAADDGLPVPGAPAGDPLDQRPAVGRGGLRAWARSRAGTAWT